MEANITPAYCGCQEGTTTYCYFTPLRQHLTVIGCQVNGVLLAPDSRTIDCRGGGFNARSWCIDVEGCGFGGKAGWNGLGRLRALLPVHSFIAKSQTRLQEFRVCPGPDQVFPQTLVYQEPPSPVICRLLEREAAHAQLWFAATRSGMKGRGMPKNTLWFDQRVGYTCGFKSYSHSGPA